MPTYYQNPESSLKRANEFCEIGKLDEALECLSDALKNRKNRMMKQQIHESIINKFLELCVELKKSQTAKDGLYSYRNLCQGVNIKSWEDAICKYMQLAESRVENAQELYQSVNLDVDDLDQDVTPERLLKYVSSEGSQERTERIMLLPSIKFLWECFRNCLDLLRYTQTSKLYHTVAQNAFIFCVKYSRRSELRKLCNLLRIHATYVQKRQAILKSDDIETQQLFLETGFAELESVMNMELWQDAFKAVEDIHSVITVSKKSQHSRTMAHYFDKLSGIFWRGEEFLFHAAASFRYFLLCKDQKKNLNSEEIAKLACRVLLSVLSVPFASNYPANDLVAETDLSVIDKKYRLLSNLLDLVKCPTRSTLIKDVIRLNIIQFVPKEFEVFFYGIEYDVEPTKINLLISSIVHYIGVWKGCNLEQYVPLLQKVAIVRLLSILPKIYTSITISKLLNLSGMSCITSLEIILVDSARKYGFPLKIDHRNQCVHFSSNFDIFESERVLGEYEANCAFPDKSLKYLTCIHSALTKVVKEISPGHMKDKNRKTAEKIKIHFDKEWESYRKRLLLRKNAIEKHKENMENIRLHKEEEEKKLLTAKLLEHEKTEKNRLMKETEERNLLRVRREQEEVKRKILLEKMETFKKSAMGSQIVDNFDLDDMNLDPDVLFCKQIEQLNKEKKEMNLKLRRQERNFDHLERAKRIEEIPSLVVQHGEKKETDVRMWEEDECKKIDISHKDRQIDLLKKKKLLLIKDDMDNFLEVLRNKRRDTYIEEINQFTNALNAEKLIRLKARAASRKKERQKEWIAKQVLLLNKKQLESSKDKRVPAVCGDTKMRKSQVDKKIINEKDLDLHLSLYPMSSFKFAKKESSINSTLKNNIEIKTDSKEPTKFASCEISPKFHRKPYFEDVKQNRHYESQVQDNQRAERFEHKTPFYSEFTSRSYNSRNDKYRSSYFSASSHRTSTEREDGDFSWREKDRLPALRNITKQKNADVNFSSSSKLRPFNSEDRDSIWSNKWLPFNNDVPHGTITIMQRKDSKSENSTPEKKTIKDPIPEISSNDKDCYSKDTEHSCTPWAKLKRHDCDK